MKNISPSRNRGHGQIADALLQMTKLLERRNVRIVRDVLTAEDRGRSSGSFFLLCTKFVIGTEDNGERADS